MNIFLNKLLLLTQDNFVSWEYVEKFDAFLGKHIDFDVTISKRPLSVSRVSIIVNTLKGGNIRFDLTTEDALYPLVVKIRKAAKKNRNSNPDLGMLYEV